MKKILLTIVFVAVFPLAGSVEAAETITFGTGSPDYAFSDAYGTAGLQKQAMPFTPASNETELSVSWYLAKQNSPSDNHVVSIWSDLGGVPNTKIADMLATAGTDLTTSCVLYTTATTSVSLTAGTKYWIVRERDGANDASNNYINCINHTTGSPGKDFDGTSWGDYGYYMVGWGYADNTGGGGGGGSGTTTPPTVIDDPAEQIFDSLMLFLASMFGMIWFMRKH